MGVHIRIKCDKEDCKLRIIVDNEFCLYCESFKAINPEKLIEELRKLLLKEQENYNRVTQCLVKNNKIIEYTIRGINSIGYSRRIIVDEE